MQGRTDWGPVIGWTDLGGRWLATGQFEKNDFGDWSEFWTVGGRLANPLHFSVSAPCLQGARSSVAISGLHVALSCETAEGSQTFTTHADSAPFRTPDGRVVPDSSNFTAEQYDAEVMQFLITSDAKEARSRLVGDQAGSCIMGLIGVNRLDAGETRNVLSIIRTAFENPDRIPVEAKYPTKTLSLLQNLADSIDPENLKQQIADTLAYLRGR